MLSCAQRCQSVLSQPVANPHSRSIAPNRPTFAQRCQRGLDHTNPGLRWTWQVFLCEIELSLKCGEHFADFIFQKCSAPISFSTVWSANRAPATLLCTSSDNFRRSICPHPRKQRPYFGDHGSHFTRKFHWWIHTPPSCYTSQLLDDWWLTWGCGWHDGGNASHDNRP